MKLIKKKIYVHYVHPNLINFIFSNIIFFDIFRTEIVRWNAESKTQRE